MSFAPERFTAATPVYDHMAEEEDILAMLEQETRTDGWRDCVERAGGTPYGEPEVSRAPNPHYGLAFRDENDKPVLGSDGKPLVDHVKLYIVAKGWAIRG